MQALTCLMCWSIISSHKAIQLYTCYQRAISLCIRSQSSARHTLSYQAATWSITSDLLNLQKICNMTTEELNKRQHQKTGQLKQARLNIVSEYYKKGYSLRKIADKVMQELGLEKAPSPNTIKKDIATLTKEWLDNRLKDRDEQVQLELERIDDCLCELWEAWYKSKEDYTQTKAKQKHLLPKPPKDGDEENGKQQQPNGKALLLETEQQRNDIRKYGDVSYIAEIRQQLQERRKLLGLYGAEKHEITGKDGERLNPTPAIDTSKLTDEELEILSKIAEQRDKQQE